MYRRSEQLVESIIQGYRFDEERFALTHCDPRKYRRSFSERMVISRQRVVCSSTEAISIQLLVREWLKKLIYQVKRGLNAHAHNLDSLPLRCIYTCTSYLYLPYNRAFECLCQIITQCFYAGPVAFSYCC